jgi:hypothetical protein
MHPQKRLRLRPRLLPLARLIPDLLVAEVGYSQKDIQNLAGKVEHYRCQQVAMDPKQSTSR